MLTIAKGHADEMIAHAREEDPNECCGILAGSDGVVQQLFRITNIRKSPYRYVMDPQEQLNAQLAAERKGRQIVAYYHSHTHSAAFPSSTDVRMATQLWDPNNTYILVSLENKDEPQIRAFHIGEDGDVTEKQLEIAD